VAGTLQSDYGKAVAPAAPPGASRVLPWLPYILALFFALASLRGVGSGCITDTDAARHFLNGAFLHDMIASGQLTRPLAYSKFYYSHLPAISIPYHPPLFPAIEALFFFVFGVKVAVARLAVALSVGISALIFYRLVRATHGSELVAFCATLSVFSLWTSQLVGTEVMLEFPSLAFTLAALYCLRDFDRGYSLRRALLFALLASAAVWTKQFAVFLGGVPPALAFFEKRWRLLFSKAMIVSTALFACAVKALMLLSGLANGAGVDQVPTKFLAFKYMLERSYLIYGTEALQSMLGFPGIFALCVVASFVWLVRYKGLWRDLNLRLYLVWALLAMGVVLLVRADTRYLIYVLPALMAISFVLIHRTSSLLLGEVGARAVLAVCAAVWLVLGLPFQPEYLRGPAAAASMVTGSKTTRVIYFGDGDGNFAAAVRQLDPKLATTVIRGDRLPTAELQPAPFEQLCRRYGIGWIVIERYSLKAMQVKWARLAGLIASPAPSMKLERSIPLDSSRPRWHGAVEVYRFTAAGPPENTLVLPVGKIGTTVDVRP
jgi:hypothetical protein